MGGMTAAQAIGPGGIDVRPIRLNLVAWFFFLLAWLLAAPGVLASTALPAAADAGARGMVESLVFSPDSQRLRVYGWSVNAATARPPTSFTVRIDGVDAPMVARQAVGRDDVGASFPGVEPSSAGFVLEVKVPRDLGWGTHQAQVSAHWNDGQLALAPIAPEAASFSGLVIPTRHWWMAAAVALWLVGHALASRRSRRLTGWSQGLAQGLERHQRTVACAIGLCFAVLVALGWTGSSLQLLVGDATQPEEHAFLSADSGVHPLVFTPRVVRSDEWQVLTPSALAQTQHQPPLPVVNPLLGVQGQNMMVIGMTGVPLRHPSALARPATWGFFFLPLGNALAWYWFFPFFACLLALWYLLNQVAAQNIARNLVIALLFCVAPYAIGWSLWPLYAAFFPVAALGVTIRMLRTTSAWSMGLLAVALGLSLAGFALVLYPPWQIPLALASALFLVAWWLDQRPASPRWKFLAPAWLLALALALVLLLTWWMDAGDAITTMQNTVYPGGRKALQGGELPAYWLARGYSNVDSLSHLGASELNPSEFGSYFFLPLPLAWLAWRLARDGASGTRWMAIAWVLFTSWTLVFVFIGVPLWLSKALFWHYVPSHRVEPALALAGAVLLALVPAHAIRGIHSQRLQATALALATASAGLVALELFALPQVFYPSLSPVLLFTMAAAAFAMAYWLVTGRIGSALALHLLVYMLASTSFNPIARAPQHIHLHPAIQPHLQSEGAMKRVLTVNLEDGMKASMALAAAGVPIVNGVFYYPQFSFWQRLHLPALQTPTVNRYQHLLFTLGDIEKPHTFQARTPSKLSDAVIVTLDAASFDFRDTGAEIVLAKDADAHALAANPHLRRLSSHAGWAWFSVISP